MTTAKKYDPAVDHEPLFDAADLAIGGGVRMGEHARAVERAVTTAYCPGHHGDKKTGVMRQGAHLVWRIHDVMTFGGARIQCSASGATLCQTGLRRGEKRSRGLSCSHELEAGTAPP